MQLPVMPPVAPMLSKSAAVLPVADGLIYEPKWDGFRCILYRDGDEVELASRNERSLTRYFPEVVEAVKARLPTRCVMDGEIVVATEHGLDFDTLSQRIHPAASRIKMLSESTPASFVAFDLLALGDEDLRGRGFSARRAMLESVFGPDGAGPDGAGPDGAGPDGAGPDGAGPAVLAPGRPAGAEVYLTPATVDPELAQDWFARFEGAGLDGVVAKAGHLLYQEAERVMTKVKHERTGDFVVGGFRWYKGGEGVGSLMLGLYDEAGTLHHVGVIGSFPMSQRRQLVDELAPYRDPDASGHPWGSWSMAGPGAEVEGMKADTGVGAVQRLPGAASRWNAKKDLSFEILRPDLVVEAAYEHLQGDRLRHTARFRHWRPDRSAKSCTYAQMEVAIPSELSQVFAAGPKPGLF